MQVSNYAEIGDLEERLILVLVDHDDGARGLHAGGVLDSTGDAQTNVEIRRDGYTGLSDLQRWVVPAFIHGVAGSAHGSGESIGQRFYYPGERSEEHTSELQSRFD